MKRDILQICNLWLGITAILHTFNVLFMIQSFVDSVSSSAYIALAVAILTALLLVFTKVWHGHYTINFHTGIQTFHTVPTPRVGGVAIALGAVAGY